MGKIVPARLLFKSFWCIAQTDQRYGPAACYLG